jgi:hypothetical protein
MKMKTVGDSVKGLFDNACCECGRKVGKNPKWIHLTTGATILPVDSDSKDSQGCWPVGAKCAESFDPKVLIDSMN